MGKQTGFLEYARATNPSRAPKERIRDFSEFHPPLNERERREQAARCMDCGVPFCQSGLSYIGGMTGCPLHNLIPEWNDMLYWGNGRHALSRLLKQNNFPEFTGRVCPALCEAACTCAIHGDAVTIRENELSIIESAFQNGWIRPMPPQERSGKRVAVVGSGPSGLAAADQLNHRGHCVTVFERQDRPGGLLMYGIPNMKLDKGIVERRLSLMQREGVLFETGREAGRDLDAAALLRDFDAVLLCCGASQPRDLKIPGREAEGVVFAVDFLKSTTKALLEGGLTEGNAISAKGKRVIVVGGGDTGNDCVGTAIRHGCQSVAQIEMMPMPPLKRQPDNPWPYWPRVLKTDYGQEEAMEVFGSDPRIFETTVKRLLKGEDGKLCGAEIVKLERGEDGKLRKVAGSERTLEADLLLIAAGFVGCEKSVAEAFGLQTTSRGCLETTRGHETAVEKLFCAGDMRRGQSLVVHAIFEGREAAREVDQFLMGYSGLN